MISAKGLELTNFINPHLTWKKVSKGYRRSTRRSRKPVDRSPKFDADLADKETENSLDTTVSESEKLGVAVLGRRFSDNIEHVPIKKRRFMVLSPSPPPCISSPRHEGKEQLMDGPHSSEQLSCPQLTAKKQLVSVDASRTINGYLPEVTNECVYSEDFSGIEILAAAACNNSVCDDSNHADDLTVVEESASERRDKSNTETPLKETVASLKKTDTSPIEMVHQDTMQGSSVQDNAVEILANEDDRTVERSVSSRDVRFHWDLNVPLDAWEQSSDTVVVDPQTDSVEHVQSEELQISEVSDILKEPGEGNFDIGSPVKPIIDNEEHRLEGSSGTDSNHDNCATSDKPPLESSTHDGIDAKVPSLNVATDALIDDSIATSDKPPLESSTRDGIDAKASSLNVATNALIDDSICPASDIITGSGLSEENKKTSLASLVTQIIDDIALGVQEDKNKCASKGPACEVDSALQNVDCDGSDMASSLHDESKSPQEMMSSDSNHPPMPVALEVKPVAIAEDVGVSKADPNCEDMCLSGVSLVDGQHVVTVNAEEQVDEASMALTDNPDEELHESSGNSTPNLETRVGCSDEACQKYGDSSGTSLGKVTVEDTYDDSCEMDVCDKDHIVGKENTRDSEAGYDSQYEDGELRESDVHWEDNNCEDGEAECVDYGSDTCENDDSDYFFPGKVGVQMECSDEEYVCKEARKKEGNTKVERLSSPGYDNLLERIEHGSTGDAMKQSSAGSKTRTSGSDQLPGGSEITSSRTVEVTEGFLIGKHNADCFGGFDDKDSSAKVVCSRASRKEFHCIEGSLSSVQRSSRSGNFDLSTQHEETGSDLSMGKERSDLQMHGRSVGVVNLANTSFNYWDSKRRPSPSCHGSFGSGRPRPKSVIESRGYATYAEATGITGPDNHIHRQGMYRPPLRRRSPANRDDTHNMHNRGMAPHLRDTSPDRRRFRRYTQGVVRGFREEYHRPMPNDSDEYSYHVPHRMPRRDSPPGRGPIYYKRPYKRSQSRSRSRSPPVGGWLLQRERDEVSKHRNSSRSPDYRFEARMERMRLPFQKQNFAAKYEEFLSPPRRRFSPQHNSRWFDDQNAGGGFRGGRRLPARPFQQQNQRFDSVGSSHRRMNNSGDDYFEPPMIRPARFPEMGRGRSGGRVRRYDGSDDERRKHDGRYEIIQRVRRYDSDGVVRRFRYGDEEDFVPRNTHSYNECDNSGGGADRRPRNAYLGGDVPKKKVSN